MDTSVIMQQERDIFVLEEADRVRIRKRIEKLRELIRWKQYSPERLWREFFSLTIAESASPAEAIRKLEIFGLPDEEILGLLAITENASSRIFTILGEADWSDSRIAQAFIRLNASEYECYCDSLFSTLGLVDFMQAGGIGKARIITALYDTGYLKQPMLLCLIKIGWRSIDVLQAIIEAGCFNKENYDLLVSFEDGEKYYWWDDMDLIKQMSQLKIADKNIVRLFIDAAMPLSNIYDLCDKYGWSTDRTTHAFVEAGVSAGLTAQAFNKCAQDRIRASKKSLKEFKAYMQTTEYRAEMDLIKESTIGILTGFGLSDEQIFQELSFLEWFNHDIVDYLLTAKWTPIRIIKAMKANGWTEYFLTELINQLAEGYAFKQNSYMSPTKAALWKKLLNRFFPPSELKLLL